MRVFPALLAVALVAAGCGGARATDGVEDRPIVPTAPWRTDFSRHDVPLYEFRQGGPGRDGIPALFRPRFESVRGAAVWLDPEEQVVSVEVRGEAKAYPLQILIWHEVVNDTVGGTPVAVTYCPLCNAAIAFDRRVGGRTLAFAVTGNLRRSNLVMYDGETETWWQQFGGEALVGELAGARLERLPASVTPFSHFAKEHPEGTVLSRATGYDRPYGARPYPDYDRLGTPTYFGTPNQGDDRVQLKERVVYVERGADAVAIPFSVLAEAGSIEVEVGGEPLEAIWLPDAASPFGPTDTGRLVGSAEVQSLDSGRLVPYDTPFWFAVAAFRPDVRVVRSSPATTRP